MENFAVRAYLYPEKEHRIFLRNLGLIYQHNRRHLLFDTFFMWMYILLDDIKYLWNYKYKVKCTPVQAQMFCTGRTANRGSRGIALIFLDHGTSRWWGVSVTPRPFFTPWKDPVHIEQESGWAPGSIWTGAESLAPTGIRSSDLPPLSQSLSQCVWPRIFWFWTTSLKG